MFARHSSGRMSFWGKEFETKTSLNQSKHLDGDFPRSGVLFLGGGPQNKDHSIFGSILGYPYLELPNKYVQLLEEDVRVQSAEQQR